MMQTTDFKKVRCTFILIQLANIQELEGGNIVSMLLSDPPRSYKPRFVPFFKQFILYLYFSNIGAYRMGDVDKMH